MLKPIAAAIAATFLLGCASGLPKPRGESVPINSIATAEMLSHDAGLMIVGPGRESVEARESVLYDVPEGVSEVRTRRLFRETPADELVALPVAHQDPELREPGVQLVPRTIVVPFDFNSVEFRPTPEQQYRIRQLAAVADRVEVRGRTDGHGLKQADAIIARGRAEAAKRYLLSRNVPNDIISVSYQAGGDYIDDHLLPEGADTTRRVELEFFVDHFVRGQS